MWIVVDSDQGLSGVPDDEKIILRFSSPASGN
jgi:hypothetical protein